MNDETRDERLRQILREGDPAGEETGLATEEIRTMRRAVLTAIPERRRRLALSPVLAGAAMAILAAIVVLWLWPRPESPMPAPPAPPRIAIEKPLPDVKSTDVKRPDGSTDVKRPDMRLGLNAPRAKAVAAGLRARRPVASAPSEQLVAAGGPPPANEPEARTRQIQFDTPGGTRVIWILTADNAL